MQVNVLELVRDQAALDCLRVAIIRPSFGAPRHGDR
jgi:hypothetical protein